MNRNSQWETQRECFIAIPIREEALRFLRETAAQFFSETAKELEQQYRQEGESRYADWSFYAAFWHPAQAHLALEADWQRALILSGKKDDKHNFNDWNKSSIAMTMSALDVERAVELARQLSDKPTPHNPSLRGRV